MLFETIKKKKEAYPIKFPADLFPRTLAETYQGLLRICPFFKKIGFSYITAMNSDLLLASQKQAILGEGICFHFTEHFIGQKFGVFPKCRMSHQYILSVSWKRKIVLLNAYICSNIFCQLLAVHWHIDGHKVKRHGLKATKLQYWFHYVLKGVRFPFLTNRNLRGNHTDSNLQQQRGQKLFIFNESWRLEAIWEIEIVGNSTKFTMFQVPTTISRNIDIVTNSTASGQQVKCELSVWMTL